MESVETLWRRWNELARKGRALGIKSLMLDGRRILVRGRWTSFENRSRARAAIQRLEELISVRTRLKNRP